MQPYAAALNTALGKNGAATLKAACDAQLDTFNTMTERVYINWLQTRRKSRSPQRGSTTGAPFPDVLS